MTKVNKFPKRQLLLFLFCFPSDILGWVLLLVTWVLSGDLIFWQNGLWITLKEKSWLGRSLFKNHNGGCICHGGWYKTEILKKGKQINSIDTRLEYHEHIHIEQYEVVNLYTVIILVPMLCSNPSEKTAILAMIIWACCWWLFVACSMLVAWFRGEDYYRGNINEESAYSQDEDYEG